MRGVLQIESEILDWLEALAITDSKAELASPHIQIRTSLGKRETNQDRTAFIQIGAQRYAGAPLMCVLVADGMGGMIDGGLAASIAFSSFASFLATGRSSGGLKRLLIQAINYANERVYQRFAGTGGTTLSAILYGTQGLVGVNAGDSRIYVIKQTEIKRLTVDDTFAEQLKQLHGLPRPRASETGERDGRLLQFVGVGPLLQPHIIEFDYNAITENASFLLATDGAHYLGDAAITELIAAGVPADRMPRLITEISRMCGSTDNASVVLSPCSMPFDKLPIARDSIRITVPGHSLTVLAGDPRTAARELDHPSPEPRTSTPLPENSNLEQSHVGVDLKEKSPKPVKRIKRAARSTSPKSDESQSQTRHDKAPSELDLPILEFLNQDTSEKNKKREN